MFKGTIKLNEYEREKLIFFFRLLKSCDSSFVCEYFSSKLKTEASLELVYLLDVIYQQFFLNRRKYIDKECYFVDYENLNREAIQYLKDKKDAIIYFVVNQHSKIDTSKIDDSNLIYIDKHFDKYKNSADYILNFNVLSLVSKYCFKKITIISNDHGFNGIIEILNSKYHQPAVLKSKYDIIPDKNIPTNKIVRDVKKLIKRSDAKKLPKEKDALKRYIQSSLYANSLKEKQLDEVIENINNDGFICLYGNTIHYQGVHYYGS